MQAPFVDQASSAAVELADLLLAAAAEFQPVDRGCVDGLLDGFAANLPATLVRSREPEGHAEAMLGLFHSEGLRVTRRVSPADALLNVVLERSEGHPLLLASICEEVGRRVGIQAVPVRSAGAVLVGIRVADRAVLIDPAGECSNPPRRATWMCAHEVAFEALSELSRLLAMHGRLEEAIRAAELRSALPLATRLKERIDFEAGALRAQLN
jgi:regulator of sirC expression with transglutaminase-like and TPR domain